MSSQRKSPDIENHLRRVAERIDARTGRFGEQAFTGFCKRLCDKCRARLGQAVPASAIEPEEASTKIMLAAAGTKRSVPATHRWSVDAELVSRLETEFRDYGRSLIGPCSLGLVNMLTGENTIIAINMPDGSLPVYTTAEVGVSLLWWRLSGDVILMQRFMSIHEVYADRIPLADFRRRFLVLCIERKLVAPDKALDALQALQESCFAEWAH